MKELLQSLLNEYKEKYAELIDFTEDHQQSKIWGMGIMPSYNPAPYTCELQGSKPGRLLKKPCDPAKDRQCYFLDENKKIIGEIAYAKYVKIKKQWIVYRNFFINKPNAIIELKFSSALEGDFEANLDSASITTYDDNGTNGNFSLLNTGEYFETSYTYKNNKIISITEKIWREVYTERSYDVNYSGDNAVLFELLSNGSRYKIYPED